MHFHPLLQIVEVDDHDESSAIPLPSGDLASRGGAGSFGGSGLPHPRGQSTVAFTEGLADPQEDSSTLHHHHHRKRNQHQISFGGLGGGVSRRARTPRTTRTTSESVGSLGVAAGYEVFLAPCGAAPAGVTEGNGTPDSPPRGPDAADSSPNEYPSEEEPAMSYSAAKQRRPPGNNSGIGGGGAGRARQRQRSLADFGADAPSGFNSRSSDMVSWQLQAASPSSEHPLPDPSSAAIGGSSRSLLPHGHYITGEEAAMASAPRQRLEEVGGGSEGEEDRHLMLGWEPGTQRGAAQLPPWLTPPPGMGHDPEVRRSADPRMHSLLQRPSNLPGERLSPCPSNALESMPLWVAGLQWPNTLQALH